MSTAQSGHGPGRPSVAHDVEEQDFLTLGIEALSVEFKRIRGIARLAASEAKLSVYMVPVLLGAAILIAALSLASWGLLMAVAATWLHQNGISLMAILAVMTAVHFAATASLLLFAARARHSIGFPETARQLGKDND